MMKRMMIRIMMEQMMSLRTLSKMRSLERSKDATKSLKTYGLSNLGKTQIVEMELMFLQHSVKSDSLSHLK
jgi:hypothetical protein